MLNFPAGFLWGAATSSHQVEGNNTNNDWWSWERSGGGKVPSASACGHYERYSEDFDIARSLGHNCHRLSFEWSRIEPALGTFSSESIDHYKDVILELRRRSIEPVVTLHHFTNPVWFAETGGFAGRTAVDRFCSYVERIVSELAGEVTYWVTINEPLIYLFYGYIAGDWPPNKRSPVEALKVRRNLILSHIRAYRIIHRIYREKGLKRPMVSIAHHMPAYNPCGGSVRDGLAVWLRRELVNLNIIRILSRNKALDYIGVNYYSRNLVHTESWSIPELLIKTCRRGHDDLDKNSLGWEIYPEGILEMLVSLKRFGLPVFVLENGICTDDDNKRWEFIKNHLIMVHKAIGYGVNVLGYVYWSLLDNYEWDKGFEPRFGIVAVDYATGKREIRPSALKYSRVCVSNSLL